MGYLNAQGMADAADDGEISVRMALSWHLSTNHYPPVPTSMIDPCLTAIDAARDDEWDTEIELPEGITFRDRPTAPARAIVEQHHLEAFL